ncbi:sugar-binding transcriptional regulator [Enterococcus sp. BWB1-3]|uniref:sugar-binding transcriptional regulator n=1 Tax=unclassified Enterococcus TaxID=2608891 RepID=UPI001924AED6|nr:MULTISPECIES: sugar-binding transcriptional regulator [unclassified Enterococcus]MBL1229358.1 sugar-binding transcriptional regulator [Enterococcus sp. BWB1-3]MCB5951281.1 sugar-binding transcriptional regulator [Enterococcus sp. BWT-B8]
MSYSDDTRLLVEIASMYYDEGAKQADIAQKFSISRSLVSKYLAKARDLGLVEIIIHDDLLHPYRYLEDKLKRKYNLEEVICTSTSGEETLIKRLGVTAAKYLARVIQPHHTVSVSAGTAVQEVALNFSSKNQLPDVKFVPMVGGLGQQHMNLQANVVCEIFAKHSGATAIEMHAPITVDSAEAKKVFMEQSFIKSVFNQAKQADIALVGIGGKPVYSTMTKAYLLANTEEITTELSNGVVVGDICYNFINSEGELSDCTWNKRVMALNLEDLKQIPRVVGVAGGKDKIDGIHAALTGHLVNVLITDEITAKALLDIV